MAFKRNPARLPTLRLERRSATTSLHRMKVEGRANVLATLRRAIAGFDGRCDSRNLFTTTGPEEVGGEVHRRWSATLTKGSAPRLVIDGTERAVYTGDRVSLLEITLGEDAPSRLEFYAQTCLHARKA